MWLLWAFHSAGIATPFGNSLTVPPWIIYHFLQCSNWEGGGEFFWENIVGEMLAYLEYFNEFWKNIISGCDLMVF